MRLRRNTWYVALVVLITLGAMGCAGQLPLRLVTPSGPEEGAEQILARMTLTEKAGQMAQVDRSYLADQNDIAGFALGSLLSGGGSSPVDNSPSGWADMLDRYQHIALSSRLAIPLLYGIDAIHGNNNVRGAVIFPHNIGMGATGDRELVWEAARTTALETAGVGIRWTFSPCVAVPQDIRWGRSYEGFGQDPALVSALGAAAVAGYQGAPLPVAEGSASLLLDSIPPSAVMATAKHFIADGGTLGGADRGDAVISESTLRLVHLPPYRAAVGASVGAVMVSFSSWNGVKDHGNRYLITDVLKGELGFRGIVVSDWGGVKELPGGTASELAQAVNAGIDMIMIPDDYRGFIKQLVALAQSGAVPETRINDAVRRILAAKIRLGLFEHPFTDRKLTGAIGSAGHRAVARRAVRESLVLLKNDDRLLPLSKHAHRIVVAGKMADDIGAQCGGWTISWQGARGNVTPGTTILEGIRRAVGPQTEVVFSPDGQAAPGDADIVVVGEDPYAEGRGDRQDLSLSIEDRALIMKLAATGAPLVVVLLSGRPLAVSSELSAARAFLAAWLPGTEGDGIADVLFGDYRPTGKLSFAWPDGAGKTVFPIGFGLNFN